MNMMQSSFHLPLSSMDHSDVIHSSPLDLSFLPQDDRGSDSPLDLSLKTRKRCADTTKVDDDVIFIAHRTLEKRPCFEKNGGGSETEHFSSPGQSSSWEGWKNKNSLSPKNGGYSENKYLPDLFHKRSLSYKEAESAIPRHCPESTVLRESVYSGNDLTCHNPFNSNTNGVLPAQQYQPQWRTYDTGLQTYDKAKSRTAYSATPTVPASSPQNIYHSRKLSCFFDQNPVPSVAVHHHQTQQYMPLKSLDKVSTESPLCVKAQSPIRSTGFVNASQACAMRPHSCITQMFLPPQSHPVLHNHKDYMRSELRAALSSSERYYHNQAAGGNSLTPSLQPAIIVPQRCSPDSTFLPSKPNVSTASVNTSASSFSSSIRQTAGYALPKHKSGTPNTVTNSPTCYKHPSNEVKRSTESQSQKRYNAQAVSDSSKGLQTCSGSLSTEILTVKNSLLCEKSQRKALSGSCEEVLNDIIDKEFSLRTNYKTPLHITIPNEKKTSKVDDSVTKRDQTASLSRHPKLRCKKHIILNAYSQDEELKSLNNSDLLKSPSIIRSNSVSPYERPGSPKMPILSPQHKFPPVLSSQCVKDPPSLRLTTEVNVEDEDDLQCPSISVESGLPNTRAGCSPQMSQSNCVDLLKDSENNMIAFDETKVPKIANLSAFVETGVAPPIDLKPKTTWSSFQLKPNITSPLGCISWKLQNVQKEPEWSSKKTGHKFIPVANVAPIRKEPIEDTSNIDKTESHQTDKLNNNKDLQAEIAAYKTSLRMPAKLIPNRPALEEKRTGIAEEFGASSSRFLHLDNSVDSVNERVVPVKAARVHQFVPNRTDYHISEVNSDTDKTKCDTDRNVWNSVFMSTNKDSTLDSVSQFSGINSSQTIKFQTHKKSWCFSPRKFAFSRLVKRRFALSEDKNDKKSGVSMKQRQRRHRRSMLDEIANSDGFVAEQRLERTKSSKVDLFADPTLLSREERALQKAMLRFTEMESGKFRKASHQKRQSNTQRKAYQLKRKAMRSSPNSKGINTGEHKTSPGKKGFVDFQPEVLPSRTRMQSKGVHSVGGYNRDAAYEKELVNDDRRKQLKRARRRARKMGNQRAHARKLRREQNEEPIGDPPETNNTPDVSWTKRKCIEGLKGCATQGASGGNENKVTIGVGMSPCDVKTVLLVDELPDLVEELPSYLNDVEDPLSVISIVQPLTRPKLRSDRNKERVHMKLSWRPVTAANKGKPRIATVRVSRKQGHSANSVRMIKLRRRAKQAYHRTSRKQRKQRGSGSDNRKSTSDHNSDITSPPVVLRSKRSKKSKKGNKGFNALSRLTRRHNQASDINSSCSRKANFRNYPSSSRYPLRDKIQKQPDYESEGYTTEEYDFEDRNYVYSKAGRYLNKGQHQEGCLPHCFPETPHLPNLSVNKNSGETALHRAARLGYEEVVLYILRTESEDLNSRDNAGYTALHEGCTGDQTAIVSDLLAHGANHNLCSLDGVRPIQIAMENNNIGIVRLLLSYGADPVLDDTTHFSRDILTFVENYLKDINGYPADANEAPWRLYGSAVLDEENCVQHNLFTNVPSDEEEDEALENMFECSQCKQFVSHRLKVPEADREDNYVLLADILKCYEMTRGMFLRELGTRVRIYSLSRQTLEEEIEQGSTACPELSDEIKELQTIEVIKLVDIQLVINHRLNLSNGSTTSFVQLKGNKNSAAITGSSSLRKDKSADPDLIYPSGMPSRDLSRSVSDLTAPQHFQLPNTPKSHRKLRVPGQTKSCKSKSEERVNSPRRCKTMTSQDNRKSAKKNSNYSVLARNCSDIVNDNAIPDYNSNHCLKARRTLSFLSYDEEKLTEMCTDRIVQDINGESKRCATTTLCNDTNRSFIDR